MRELPQRVASALASAGDFVAALQPAAAEDGVTIRWDKIDYPDTDQWGSCKAQQKLHFKAFFHAVH